MGKLRWHNQNCIKNSKEKNIEGSRGDLIELGILQIHEKEVRMGFTGKTTN